MKKKSYAKINLTLDSLFKREDDYHEIDSIMAKIDLYDEITINKNFTDKINIKTNMKDLEVDENNLVYKAWILLKDLIEKKEKSGVDVYIKKNIPIASGLAGGSSNAAYTLMALNEIFNLNLSKEYLMSIAKKIGADVSFFFCEKIARAQGIGEVLTPFENKLDLKILLLNDKTKIKSKKVYQKLKNYGIIDTEEIINKLEAGDFSAIYDFKNVMEDVVFEMFPHLKDIKNELKSLGCEIAMVSGSGGSIFGVFKEKESLKSAYEKLKNKYYFVSEVSLL